MENFSGVVGWRCWLAALALCICAATPCAPENGYSAAVSVRSVVKTTVDGSGQPIHYPTKGEPEISGLLVEIPAGQNTGWHKHPSPCVAYVIEGDLTVESAEGNPKQFKAGDTIVEAVNVKH